MDAASRLGARAPSPLSFRCTGCGNCCRTLRVAVTTQDVARLARATGQRSSALIEWLSPDRVDMTGEPDSFVDLREGRRLMVLKHAEGACSLLGADNRCRAYAARPRDCRAFPFDFERAPHAHAATHSLKLLPLEGCDYATDGENDASELERLDGERWLELEDYRRTVATWNRHAWHRRRLRHRLGGAEEFLAFSQAKLGISQG